jgi:hypothetical protein
MDGGTRAAHCLPLIDISPAASVQKVEAMLTRLNSYYPDAVFLLAMIMPPSCMDSAMETAYNEFYHLIAKLANKRQRNGSRVLAVDFFSFPKGYMDRDDPQLCASHPRGLHRHGQRMV